MKGICFIEPLHGKTVKKIKVQTRRIIPNCDSLRESPFKKSGYETWHGKELKPRYNVGEILYLKEPYRFPPDVDFIVYKFDYPNGRYEYPGCDKIDTNVDWKNKLFMPASAARHFIKITAVRAERLQDISNEDCIKEGIYQTECIAEDYFEPVYENGYNATSKKSGILCIQYDTPREAYAALIDAINGKDTWDNNPWVWVYDYELIDRKEVQI